MIVETVVPDTYEQAYRIYRNLFEELVGELMNDQSAAKKYGDWSMVAHSQGYVCDNYLLKGE